MELFKGTRSLLVVAMISCIIVFIAMLIDLISGLYKAHLRHEVRSSFCLRRSVSKFMMYEGGMLLAVGIDLIMHFCQLFKIMHLNSIYGIPLITCLIGIFLLIIEFISVMEKADSKTKSRMMMVENTALSLMNKQQLVAVLNELLSNAIKNNNNDNGNNTTK